MSVYWLTVLSVFLIFYAGFNKNFLDSICLAIAVSFLLVASGVINPLPVKKQGESLNVWV